MDDTLTHPNVQGRIYSDAFKEQGRADVVLWDVVDVVDGERWKLSFESTNSPDRQGVWIRTDRGIDVNGIHAQSVSIWSDSIASEEFTVNTGDGKMHIYNIYERDGRRMSQAHSSGMLIDVVKGGFLYKCNDYGFDTSFDKLVFKLIRKMNG